MAISYLTILSNQKLIPELFSDKRWQELVLAEKKETIYSIFHIKNWKQLNPEYRIYILQELENINASMQERIAYKIKMVENNDFTGAINKGPYNSREIWVNKKYLFDGIRYRIQMMEDGTKNIFEEQLENINVALFCSICHEGEHAKQEEGIKNDINTKEINECRLNFLTHPDDKKKNNIINASEDVIFYKFQPAEYYAFLNSENETRTVFSMLQAKFGIDEGYTKWYEDIKSNGYESIAKQWNINNNMKEWAGVEYTVTGIRKKVMNLLLDNMQEWYNIHGSFKACEILNLNYKDYSPNMMEDWVLESNEHEEK